MAYHPKKRIRRGRSWNPNESVVPQFNSAALGTLANATLIGSDLTPVADEEYRALSLNLLWAARGATAGEGPIVVGIAHGDYTDAEIEAWVEGTAAMSRGDLIAQEIAQRKIWRVGVFSNLGSDEVLNDGKPIRIRMNWHVVEGDIIRQWAYNQSGAPLTTGQNIVTNGSLHLRWT